MSYILEALKRAEAERERGAVPTLRSQSLPAATPLPAVRPAMRWAAALVAALALAGIAAWWTLGRGDLPTPLANGSVAALTSATTITAAPRPEAAASALQRTSPPTPATPPANAPEHPSAVAAPAIPRPTPFNAATSTNPRRSAEATAGPKAARNAASAAAVASAAQPAAPPPAATAETSPASAKPPAAESRVLTLAELPEDVRQQLPKLAISGGTYSAQAAYRMLIVNGQVLHENDEMAPGLTLETIRPKDAVLRFRGYRYSVGY